MGTGEAVNLNAQGSGLAGQDVGLLNYASCHFALSVYASHGVSLHCPIREQHYTTIPGKVMNTDKEQLQ